MNINHSDITKFRLEHEEKSMSHLKDTQISTKCVHAGQEPEILYGCVNVPIYTSTTYAQTAPAEPFGPFDYSRCGNPTRNNLERSLAFLENGKYGLVWGSGMASINGVIETFESLKENGVTIVIFTESEAYHTLSRIKTLKLDGIVDYVYAPPSKNHEIPSLSKTKFVQLQDSEHQKPNPKNLNKIIVELGIDKENCCYLGDNPMKDIQMAKIANVTDIYAKYGDIDRNTKEYQLLKAVTYWKDSLVKKEENINTDKISPSYTLNTSIRELLKIFNIKEELHV